ncbi:hypothetical protein DO97_11655 [Neosynechococcus sphagnicola sy1]|uniref:Response regulatory domain-containing protein n=1 Tax=Neosynechococcus sphagnicola sy1 TaxID=1497020 RepID=A0A098TJB9_9CYAN|nr:response regulator [Neosynechococcus sphagnicola]KGF72199.1 hypothetical protein DO97_11655 [Neosynechococcus sphagnicola sy1]
MVAEDNIVNQTVILKILEKLGYQAEVVNNGLEVLAALQQHAYEVVLMDVQMPQMDGLAATRQICQTHNPRPQIIALTANAMAEDRDLCLAAGMDDYLSKPIQVKKLQQALERSRQRLQKLPPTHY